MRTRAIAAAAAALFASLSLAPVAGGAGVSPGSTGCGAGNASTHEVGGGAAVQVYAVATTRGDVLVGYATPNDHASPAPAGPLTVYELDRHCHFNLAFGTRGIVRPRLPLGEPGSDVAGIAPSRDGGFFVLANDHRSWWVGKFSARGALVRSFGSHGWTSMLPPGGWSDYYPSLVDVIQSNSGMIYVAGNNAQSHGVTSGYLAALLPTGRLDRAFGTAGFTPVLPQMTWVGPMFLQPNGTIAVTGWLGGGGCGVMEIEWVTTDGQPARWIDRNYDGAHGYPLKSCFGGLVFADAEGGVGIAGNNFSLQGPQRGTGSVPNVAVRIEALTGFGEIDPAFGNAGRASYRIPVMDGVATTQSGDVVFLGTQTGRVTLVDFSANGSPVRGFGRNDAVHLAYNSRFNGNVLILSGPQNHVTVVVRSPNAISVHELAA